MKILNLKIEGFRSLKAIDWSPGDLNVVIGPNNGGKSNLLNALEMIAASAKGKLKKFVNNQGGMEILTWDGKAENIRFHLCLPLLIKNREKTGDKFDYEVNLSKLKPINSYQINNEKLRNNFRDIEDSSDQDVDDFINRSPTKALFFHEGLSNTLKNIDEQETILSMLDESMLSDNLACFVRNGMSGWGIFYDINTGKNSTVRQTFVTSYEKNISPSGSNFIAVLHTLYTKDRDFKSEINQAMKAAFGDDFEELSFAPAADGRSQLRIFWKNLEKSRSAADISDGTLRFLYLLTILAHPEPPSLIAIDEPETGLHPSMLPIIAEYAVEASRKTQVILTTHSPEFLSAFGKDIRPTTTVVEWENGQTKLRVLKGETLDYWLKEYSLGELYRSGQLEDME